MSIFCFLLLNYVYNMIHCLYFLPLWLFHKDQLLYPIRQIHRVCHSSRFVWTSHFSTKWCLPRYFDNTMEKKLNQLSAKTNQCNSQPPSVILSITNIDTMIALITNQGCFFGHSHWPWPLLPLEILLQLSYATFRMLWVTENSLSDFK